MDRSVNTMNAMQLQHSVDNDHGNGVVLNIPSQ